MAWGDIQSLAGCGTAMVGLCDVDERQAVKARKRFPQAAFFRDYRVMLDTLDKQIDAVLVATPDHVHAVAAMTAITIQTLVLVGMPGSFGSVSVSV